MHSYTEDTLVQKTADHLRDELGRDSVYAYNLEDFGADLLLLHLMNGVITV